MDSLFVLKWRRLLMGVVRVGSDVFQCNLNGSFII